jgi:hypothetical protein
MKQYTMYLLLLCLIACKHKQEPPALSVAITILYDPTDTRQIQPSAEFPLGLYELDKNKQSEAYFRITSTTDMVVNPSKEVYLLQSTITEKANVNDDPYYREKNVLAFYKEVRQTFKDNTNIIQDQKVYHHSECFRTICREITELKKKKCTKSILIIYGDLQECSDVATVYKSNEIDTARIKKVFNKTKLLPDTLTGLTVYVLFQPRDRIEDKKFMSMYVLYQELLETRGANIVLQSTNNKTQQL